MSATLCVASAGTVAVHVAAAFTLAWTHSVERTRWEEDWRLTGDGRLAIVEARVKGSGAGMEPPDGAVLRDGWWTYAPSLAPRDRLVLAASGATGGGWTICFGADCAELGGDAGAPVEIRACTADAR
ncbi:MAG: DUF1850 domain-containing protein [Rhizobiaceae bacterium]|nr:DUF1850 domain-containing protein [Rhizobiaceae bacterium]